MDQASEALFVLKPVTFRYKKEIDPAGKSQLGLVAEDVEKVNPDLVVRDKEGKPYEIKAIAGCSLSLIRRGDGSARSGSLWRSASPISWRRG